MRQARVFNNIREVQMEMNVLGIRIRALGIGLIVASMAIGTAVAMTGHPIIGILAFAAGFTIAIRFVNAINSMSDVDATGLRTDLRETTQLSLLIRSMFRPAVYGDDYLTAPYRDKPKRGRRRG